MPLLSTDPRTIAKRLLEARSGAGYSTREVAARLKKVGVRVSHATIGNYERAASTPTIDLLQHLAVLYSRDLEWFLASGPEPRGIRYRKTVSRVKASEERRYVANATRWLEAYRRLEQKSGRVLKGAHAGFRAKQDQTGKELAESVRERILRLQPFDPLPSVISVLQDTFGVRVIEEYTESRIDAFAARYGDEHAVVLNPRASNDRGRLNSAHELGHVLFSDCDTQQLPHKEVESRTYDFAFYLMMSECVLREAFKGRSMVKLVKYKETFGVSMAAMIYRAEKAGILSKNETEWLWRQFSMRGWRQREPGEVRADRATRFETMFEEVTAERVGQLSMTEALRLMGVREEEMQARLDLAAGIVKCEPDGRDDSGVENEKGGPEPDVIQFPQ